MTDLGDESDDMFEGAHDVVVSLPTRRYDMRWTFTVAAVAAAVLLAGCGPVDEDCPICEDRCWEGGPQCRECRARKGCPLADPKAGDGVAADIAELPAA